jgi:hypothetical protein
MVYRLGFWVCALLFCVQGLGFMAFYPSKVPSKEQNISLNSWPSSSLKPLLIKQSISRSLTSIAIYSIHMEETCVDEFDALRPTCPCICVWWEIMQMHALVHRQTEIRQDNCDSFCKCLSHGLEINDMNSINGEQNQPPIEWSKEL